MSLRAQTLRLHADSDFHDMDNGRHRVKRYQSMRYTLQARPLLKPPPG